MITAKEAKKISSENNEEFEQLAFIQCVIVVKASQGANTYQYYGEITKRNQSILLKNGFKLSTFEYEEKSHSIWIFKRVVKVATEISWV